MYVFSLEWMLQMSFSFKEQRRRIIMEFYMKGKVYLRKEKAVLTNWCDSLLNVICI